ncbi:hypothetical protein CFFPNG_02020 [Methylorubrum aminovorans]
MRPTPLDPAVGAKGRPLPELPAQATLSRPEWEGGQILPLLIDPDRDSAIVVRIAQP